MSNTRACEFAELQDGDVFLILDVCYMKVAEIKLYKKVGAQFIECEFNAVRLSDGELLKMSKIQVCMFYPDACLTLRGSK